MILTDEEVEDRLESKDNLSNKLAIIKLNKGGKREGDKEVPGRVKELLGSIYNNGNETQAKVGEVFGVTQAAVSCTSRGLTNTGAAGFDSELAEKVATREKGSSRKNKANEEKQEEAHESALNCLVEALGLLAPKLKEIDKPKDLARIAADMSRAAGNLKKVDKDTSPTANVQVVIYTPQMKDINHYETVEA